MTIHHISCLNHDYFQLVLDKSLDFLWESYPVDEIRIHIFNEKHGETKDIPKELKNTLNSFQFRYKAQITTSSGMSTIMGKPRPERKLCRNYKLNQFDMEIQCLSQLNLHVKNNIILSKHEGIKEPTPVPMRYMNTAGGNEETLLIDNKFSIVVSLLKLCDEIIPGFGSSSTHHNRFSDLLEEVGSLDQFTVEMADILIPENKTQITNFIEKYTINKTTIFKKPSIIVLQNMRFSWSACSHITLAIEYENFKFLRFQYNLKHYSSDLGSIFIVPTTNSKINTFYIKINTMKHTDVFYYVQEFMKISKDCYKEISEL